MVSMRIIDLYNNRAIDLRPLIRMGELEILRLGKNPITDFSPLENLENLKFLEIDREKLTDPSLLKIKARNPKIDIRGVD